ncbi:carbohydrate kinase family protein [Halovivax cerinus]|uniref:Carbohydrate kinase family protein n=1 Tax=Halovivax cerinus TaxID=1487865 RepID=A0ABD5NJ27_9EURY|nr:PfkB family carbohydrate kinase [Halovivax cerinus]
MDRCVVAGHVNWDVTLRVDSLPSVDGEATIRERRCGCGGSAANVASALAALDVDVSLVGSVGSGDCGDSVVQSLEESGVDCSGVRRIPGRETTRKYILVDDAGAVAVVGADGANEALEPAAVDPSPIRRADHVHLTSNRSETTAHAASVATSADVPVSFDPGRRIADRSIEATLPHVDVLFLSGREAETIRGTESGELSFGERTVVVTAGSDGAVVHAPDATRHHAGYTVPTTDTTGAGDAFAAGFLTAWHRDEDCDRALRVGNACGAIAASQLGAQPSLTWSRVRSVCSEHLP